LFFSSVAWRSAAGVAIVGGGGGLGLIVLGRRGNNGAVTIFGCGMVLLTLATLAVGYGVGSIGDGYTNLLCTVCVTDVRTGRPVPGAEVRVRDFSNWTSNFPKSQITPGEGSRQGTADNLDAVLIRFPCRTFSQNAYFARRTTVFAPPLCLQVEASAPGYDTEFRSLYEFIGPKIDYQGDGPPPIVITVTLNPKSSDNSQSPPKK
jgi:hypothetical protein